MVPCRIVCRSSFSFLHPSPLVPPYSYSLFFSSVFVSISTRFPPVSTSPSIFVYFTPRFILPACSLIFVCYRVFLTKRKFQAGDETSFSRHTRVVGSPKDTRTRGLCSPSGPVSRRAAHRILRNTHRFIPENRVMNFLQVAPAEILRGAWINPTLGVLIPLDEVQ